MTKLRVFIIMSTLLFLLLYLSPVHAFKHAIIMLFRISTTNVNASPTAAAQAALRAEQSADLPTHYYYRLITITNQESTSLSNYQVRIPLDTASLISAGKLKSDCSDIRVYSMTGSLLPYWIEDSGCNKPDTGIWTKVPSIPASGSIQVKLLYGNETMTEAADGHAVFEFFDDFESYPLDSSMDGQGGWVTAKGGYISETKVIPCYNNIAYKCVAGHDSYAATIMRPFTVLPGTAIGARVMLSPISVSGYNHREIIFGFSDAELINDNRHVPVDAYYADGWTSFYHPGYLDFHFGVKDTVYGSLPVVAYQSLRIDFKWTPSKRLEVFVDDVLSAYRDDAYTHAYDFRNHIFFGTYMGFFTSSINPDYGLELIDSVQYDYLYVRKAADHDPTVSVGPESHK